MGLEIGTTDATAVYVGTTAASAVYLGSTQVWPPAPLSNISYVGAVSVSGTSITIPAHAVGDLMVMFALRSATTTFATVPAGWTTLYTTTTAVNPTMKIAYKIATATNDASGTWTNAGWLVAAVWSGASGPGALLETQAAASSGTTRNYPAVTMNQTDGSSWVVRFARWGHTSTPTAPAGYTQRLDDQAIAIYLIDTNGGVTSAGALAQTMSPGTSLSRLVTLELLST